MGTRNRARRRLGGAVLTVALTTVAWSSPGAAAPAQDLVGHASAHGMRMTYTVPAFLVTEELMDGGGPVSQAAVDTLGRASAFGSLPYPGATGIAGPALLGFVLGQPLPVSYPFYAAADYPVVPDSEVRDPSGIYDLHATADAGRSAGYASMGSPAGAPGPVSGSKAVTSAALEDDGSARITAESIDAGLSFGDGMLTIVSVVSRSVTTLGADGSAPVTVTELIIEGARVGDQAVTIDAEGIHPAGSTIPASSGSADGLNAALAATGLSARTISAGGGAGDMLVVTSKHPLPGTGAEGTFVWRIGGASTRITFGEAATGA